MQTIGDNCNLLATKATARSYLMPLRPPTATHQPVRELTFFSNDQTEQQPCTEEKTKPTVVRWLHWIFWCQRPSVQYPQPLGDHVGGSVSPKKAGTRTDCIRSQTDCWEFADNCWYSQSAAVRATHLWCTSLQQETWLTWSKPVVPWLYSYIKARLMSTCVILQLNCRPAATTSLFMEELLLQT